MPPLLPSRVSPLATSLTTRQHAHAPFPCMPTPFLRAPEQARLQPSHALQMSSSRAINRLGPNPVLSPRGPAHRGQVSCSAKIGSGAVEAVRVDIPQSQEQAIQEACTTLASHMKPFISKGSSSKKSSKGFSAKSKTSAELFAIEIPVAGEDAASTSELAASVAGQLSSSLNAKFTLVFADNATTGVAKRLVSLSGCKVVSLQDACRGENILGPLLIVCPKVTDVALVEQLIDEVWLGGAPAAVLNSEFPAAPVPAQYKGLSDSILVVWSFLPISLGGLMGGKEGAVLRNVNVVGAAAKDATWRIVYRQSGDNYVACGKTKQRPSNNDLELAFLNASAAMSPVTSTVKAMKNLIPNFGGFGKKK